MRDNARSRKRRLLSFVLAAGTAGLLVVVGWMMWMSARVAKDTPHPPRMDLAEKPEDVGITAYESVTFRAEDGVDLRGWYVPSHNGAAIILAHGYAAARDDMLSRAATLVEGGYGVLLFDFRGHGESGGDLVTIGDHEQRDLRAAVDFVASQPGVDSERIGVLGFSMGGATVIEVAADDPRIKAVIAEAAFPTLRDTLNHRAKLFGPLSQIPARWAIRAEGVNFDAVRPVDDLCRISPRPLLLIYGSEDPAIPPGTPERMEAALCDGGEVWVIEGATHGGYGKVQPEQYPARLRAFFDAALGDEN